MNDPWHRNYFVRIEMLYCYCSTYYSRSNCYYCHWMDYSPMLLKMNSSSLLLMFARVYCQKTFALLCFFVKMIVTQKYTDREKKREREREREIQRNVDIDRRDERKQNERKRRTRNRISEHTKHTRRKKKRDRRKKKREEEANTQVLKNNNEGKESIKNK